MKKAFAPILIFGFIVICKAQPTISLELFGPTFDNPVSIKHANDDRLFIVEQPGKIQILNSDGSMETTPFLDIESQVNDGSSERGLLGLAFHPSYATNGYFYVNYTNNAGNTVISRFTRNAMDSNLADPSSEVILMTISQPYANHNGGDLSFGPDGYLYIALGDGGSSGDPQDRAQDLNSLLGKMLRIDVDSGSPYGIPPNNPYLNDGDPSTLPEIWAYGLRNPWRFSIDLTNNYLWIADVGQGQYEEINRVPITTAGVNYGWRCFEGSNSFNLSGCPPSNTMTFPIAEYSHSNSGLSKCSITGGYWYNGSQFPNFDGLYFFADYCSNEIGYLKFDNGSWNMTFTGPYGANNWSTFGEDQNGELYIAGITSNRIHKIVDASLSVNGLDAFIFEMFPNPAQGKFSITNSGRLNIHYEIFDMGGKRVKSFRSNKQSIEISVEDFSKGIYFVKATSENGIFTKKLVIH